MAFQTYDQATRWAHARKASAKTKAALYALKSWHFSTFNIGGTYGLSYHTCRLCRRGHPEVRGLWKYGVRHYACDDCRNAALEGYKAPKAVTR